MAIIAVLMGILLPVVTSARARSNTLKCQTQLREIMKGVMMYAAEYKGRLPFGEYDVPRSGNPQRRFLWCSLIAHYLDLRFDQSLLSTATPDPEQFGKVFKCPDAPERSPLSYACHPVAMPWREFEEGVVIPGMPASRAVMPAIISNLYARNVLLFETGCSVSTTWFYPIGYSVDGSQLVQPDRPEYRYFRQSDPYATDPNLGNNWPISKEPGLFYTNKDSNQDWSPPVGKTIPNYPWRGNVRYRHNLNKLANFAFADGHIESMTQQDCKRYMWLLRWPGNTLPADGIQN
jgi:prepilin-type processing-associated H-X9-DG protein